MEETQSAVSIRELVDNLVSTSVLLRGTVLDNEGSLAVYNNIKDELSSLNDEINRLQMYVIGLLGAARVQKKRVTPIPLSTVLQVSKFRLDEEDATRHQFST